MFDLLTAQTSRAELRLVEDLPTISVVGLGYVGAVSTACLAHLGHQVIGVDIDTTKTEAIAKGQSPIHEAELEALLTAGVRDELVSTTTDLTQAVTASDITFVSVGTPTAADGGCDTTYIRDAARAIGRGLQEKPDFHVVVMRCSIPPGTTQGVMVAEIEAVSGLKAGRDFGVCFNPEFLREGVAVADFREPPKTVIGASDKRSGRIIAKIYEPVDPNPILTTIETAEMVKYVDNVWHATKVCFGNEIGRLCKPLTIDSHKVMEIFCQDTKLNLSPYYLRPGFAYGGSCLPKEVRAVRHIAETVGADLPLINSLQTSNQTHIAQAVEMVKATGARHVGVLGLSFKPGTDDLRESPILEVIAALREDGIDVVAYDPAITDKTPIASQLAYIRHSGSALRNLAHELPRMLLPSADEVATISQALIVTQSNDEFREVVELHKNTQVIDVVRLFKDAPENLRLDGIGW
ncbi:MAG: nucleotide sugar dehydrogenase [Pseudomonadota bacterium]